MSLYNDIKSKMEAIGDVVSDLQKEADSIDNDVRNINQMIDDHRCETVEEFEYLLSEIKDKLEAVSGRLY